MKSAILPQVPRRLFDCLIERAEYIEDLDLADRALLANESAVVSMAVTPFFFRRAAGTRSGLRRELVVPAVRHQREEDFH